MLKCDEMHMTLKRDQKSSWKYTIPDINHMYQKLEIFWKSQKVEFIQTDN